MAISGDRYTPADERAITEALFELNPELRDYISTQGGNIDGGVGRQTMPQVAEETNEAGLGVLFGTPNNFLFLNPFSPRWTWANIKKDPLTLPVYYIFGMIGYTLALPIRIIIFTYSLFKLITVFFDTLLTGEFNRMGDRMKLRGLVFLGATGELVSGTIGIACPPVAYKFDEWIQSNRTIHAWYHQSWLSFWSFELDRRVVGAQDVGFGGTGVSIGNEDRMELKKERVEEELKFYKAAHGSLCQYMSKEEISTRSEDVLMKVATVGFLNAMNNGRSLTTFKEEALDKIAPDEKEEKRANLDQHERLFLKYWDALSNEAASRARGFISWLPFMRDNVPVNIDQFNYDGFRFDGETLHKLIQFELILDRDLLTNDETYFEGGVKGRQRILKALMNIYFKEGIRDLYKENEEVARHVDAFFGVVKGNPETVEELTTLRKQFAALPTPQQGDNKAVMAKMQLGSQVAKLSGELRGSIVTAQKDALAFLEEEELLEMVTFEGEEKSLRDVVKAMVSELSAFTSDWFASDREMATVITREVFP